MNLQLRPLYALPENEKVEMRCEFRLPDRPAASGDAQGLNDVQWSHDGSPVDKKAVGKTQPMVEQPNVFECSLTIGSVQHTDEGTYCCRVQPATSAEPLSSSTVLLVLPATKLSKVPTGSGKRAASGDASEVKVNE